MYNTQREGRAMTDKQVAKMLRMRDKGESFTYIAHSLGVSITTVRRYCRLDGYPVSKEVTKSEKPFIATEKTCGGCMYFKKLHSTHKRNNFCAYTLMTGKAKDITVPCARCKLKRSE